MRRGKLGLASVEDSILYDKYGKWLWVMRQMPSHAAHWLTGLYLPPHERLWLQIGFSDYRDTIIVASRGTSKCLAMGTPVLMYDGTTKRVEDVKPGDKLVGPDGGARYAVHTATGYGPLYKVRQDGGMEYVVNEDHILSLRKSSKAVRYNPSLLSNWSTPIVNVPVEEYLKLPSHIRSSLVGWSITGDEMPIEVVPYGEGPWAGFTVDQDHLFALGDGTVTHNSFTMVSLVATHRALLYKNINSLLLSSSGFRGGKQLFRDTERMFRGQLISQHLPGDYLLRSVANARPNSGRVVQRDPSIWTINLRSNSAHSTVPTNNPDQLRGLRATDLYIDERNFFSDGQEVIHGVVLPMLAVGQDFRRAAAGGDHNRVFQFSTIDYTVRDWYPEVQAAKNLALRQYEAYKAMKAGEWDEYDKLMDDNDRQLRTASFSYTKVDYTDLIIPQYVTPLSKNTTYRVNLPLLPGMEEKDVLKYDPADDTYYYYLYPVNKSHIEEDLKSGTADEQRWLAENRNCFIESSGNVFEYDLLTRVAERPIYDHGEIPGYEHLDEEFYAPIMYACGDPCVIGVDYARESDETAFVVIRLGELAEGEFDPFMTVEDDKGRPCLGNTPWNSIIWAESHRRMEAGAAAEKIREMIERYNVIYTTTTGGVALDQKGGGSAVRDILGNPKPPVGPDGLPDPTWHAGDVLKVFDPRDSAGFAHYAAYNNPKEYWGGLTLINATNTTNVEWTFGTRAMMQQRKLYIGYWEPVSRWARDKGLLTHGHAPDRSSPEFIKWEAGYSGIKRLQEQLVRIQRRHSESGLMRFVMPGDPSKEDGKKDLWAALIYAVSLAREHLVNLAREDNTAPEITPVWVTIGSDYRPGSDRVISMYD